LDTAYLGENELEVGKAIANKISQGSVKREDFFLTSKVEKVMIH
jgi:diketogulonate reductase-like aldo/keto reductase